MTKKLTSTKIALFLVFLLATAIIFNNGNVYAQNATETNSIDPELSSTATAGVTNENTTNATQGNDLAEQTSDEHTENSTTVGTIVRDSQTVLLEGQSLPGGSFLHLYDSTPYQINNGHVAAKVPCGGDNQTSVNILLGQAPNLNPAELEYIAPLSEPGNLCLYHADVSSTEGNPMTDIAIQNNSTEEIDFPATSTIVLGVNEITPLPSENHDE